MLTIKNVLPDGHEDVLPVERVSFSPGHSVESPSGNTGEKFPDSVYGDTGKEVIPFLDGTVYVMNDSGRTVTTYHLRYPAPNIIDTQKTIKDYVGG